MADYYTSFSAILTLKTEEERTWVTTKYKELREKEDPGTGMPCADFEASLDDEGHFWIRDNGESGNLDDVVSFAQEFLQKFRPKGSFSIEWAHTCSKHRLDGFGGGAAFVTAKTAKWLNTNHWLSEQLEKYTGKKGK